MHIHVLMLCRKFELIPIKFEFFYEFLSCSKSLPPFIVANEDLALATELFKKAHELDNTDASYTYAQLLRLGRPIITACSYWRALIRTRLYS